MAALTTEQFALANRLVEAMEAQAMALDSIAFAIPDASELNQAGADIAVAIEHLADAVNNLEQNR